MKTMDARMMQKAFLAGAKGLEAKKEWINELNVFPVPDGDTGTNMTMTVMAAAREVAALEDPTVEELAKAISSGSLRGARGNSGVILSQLFRGLTKELKKSEEITTVVLANAFMRAAETAYKAVMKPKEGTILTVAKGMADKAVELAGQTDDIIEFSQQVIAHGEYVLSQTPEMLPVLKQAGVVDSGGQGLMQVMKGALDGLLGKEIDYTLEKSVTDSEKSIISGGIRTVDQSEEIRFGYCTEFIINLEQTYDESEELRLKSYLESIGDSLVVVSDDGIVKVHVHTNDPGLAIQKALTYGSLSRMKIDNMREEHQERLLKEMKAEMADSTMLPEARSQDNIIPETKKPYGFIAVSVGEGLGEIFRGIGADYLIEGGQTMNPSTEDLLVAVDQVQAETVYIFPNNKNIILAAEQAKSLVKDKQVIVVPSVTVPQGITAMIHFLPDLAPEENLDHMQQEMKRVKTGQITYAVRNTVIDGYEIRQGDIMGIGDNGILAVGRDISDTVLETMKNMVEEDTELITIYYGNDIVEEEAQRVFDRTREQYPDCEMELHSGGQPVYYYLISAE